MISLDVKPKFQTVFLLSASSLSRRDLNMVLSGEWKALNSKDTIYAPIGRKSPTK
jgi:hypothetical protein